MKPMAVCPACTNDEPLVCSLLVKYKEWVCVKCGRWFEWMEPRSMEPSPRLEALYKVNLAIYHQQADKLVRGSI